MLFPVGLHPVGSPKKKVFSAMGRAKGRPEQGGHPSPPTATARYVSAVYLRGGRPESGDSKGDHEA